MINPESLRPTGFESFTGQGPIVADLHVALKAAQLRGETLGHVLYSGGPGLGKTTLAQLVANAAGGRFIATMGTALTSPADLTAILAGLRRGDVLFIDELHRVPVQVQEVLYPAMEDAEVKIVVGQGQDAETLTVPLQPFTLIGATTRRGLISGPLLDRFAHSYILQPYSDPELAKIIADYEEAVGAALTPDARLTLASYSKNTARIAIRLLGKLRDYAAVYGTEVAGPEHVVETMKRIGISRLGLDSTDIALLKALAGARAPLGLNTLAGKLGEDKSTIEDSHEPWLLRAGLVEKTPRGRVLADAGYNYLGLPRPKVA